MLCFNRHKYDTVCQGFDSGTRMKENHCKPVLNDVSAQYLVETAHN